MSSQHLKAGNFGQKKENHVASYAQQGHMHGTKRKRDSGMQAQQNGDIRGTNGASHGQKSQTTTVEVHDPNRSNEHQPQRYKKYHTNGTHPSSTPTIREIQHKLSISRANLPIHPHTSSIRQSLAAPHHVLTLSGSTGSGKSTQVPQMLLDEPWCTGGCIAVTQPRRVAAISLAVRVAQEMGSTLGKEGRNSKVGYSVRFDENVPPKWGFPVNGKGAKGKGSAGTGGNGPMRIKYMTEGMLVQEIARDPWLKAYKAVIVDEVHERSVNVDLILGFLQRILIAQESDDEGAGKGGTKDKSGNGKTQDQDVVARSKSGRAEVGKLKVVVMSATADTEQIFGFFDNAYKGARNSAHDGAENNLTQPDLTLPIKINGAASDKSSTGQYIDESWEGFSSEDEKPTNTNQRLLEEEAQVPKEISEISSEHISTCHIEGRQYPVEVIYMPEAAQDFVEAALKTIFQIHYKEPLPGDILVFLTGQDTVENLEGLIREHAEAMSQDVPKLLILPLFAALPQAAQQLVFQPTPPRTRKVILATNIAETSLTIPGIRHVVDCGLAKMKEYRATLALDSLLVKPISQSSAIQRKGRAGREAPGKCWRLYTEAEYFKLAPAAVPEILRCDLAAAVLVMKARGVTDVIHFPLLDRPSPEAMRRALLQLHRLGALDSNGTITKAGQQMARLPLPPQLARVLIAAANSDSVHNVLLDMIDIVACLSVESIFLPLTTEDKKEEAEAARHELYRREGDHLTLMAALQAYAAEDSDRRAWCDKHFVSHRAMRNAMDIRKQLRMLCQSLSLLRATDNAQVQKDRGQSQGHDNPTRVPATSNDTPTTTTPPATAATATAAADRNTTLLRALLTGFSHNTARLCPDGSYKTLEGAHPLAIHPSSVLFGRKVEAIVYNELVWTTRCWARGVSAVRFEWWAEAVGIGGGAGGGGFGDGGE